MKYFLDTIEHLVCRKMCNKNFENRLTNKKKRFWTKTFLIESPVQKSHEVGGWGGGSKYFFGKKLNPLYFIIGVTHYTNHNTKWHT